MASSSSEQGSPRSSSSEEESFSGERMTRTQAKKIISNKIEMIAKSIKSLETFAMGVGSNNKAFDLEYTDNKGVHRKATISKKNVRELRSQIISEIKKLPSEIFALTKTRRKTGPTSGFLAPYRYSDELINFLKNAELGPLVEGELVRKQDKAGNLKISLSASTLREAENQPLQNQLWFLIKDIQGINNPLYGITSASALTPLFALHSYYGNSRQGLKTYERDMTTGDFIMEEGTPVMSTNRLAASMAMRTYLKGIITATINKDAEALMEKYPGRKEEIEFKRNQLIKAIDDPNLWVNSRVGDYEMFNPNYFSYSFISKLISNAKISTGEQALSAEEMMNKREGIKNFYQNLIEEMKKMSPEEADLYTSQPEVAVFTAQQEIVSKARVYKLKISGKTQKKRKKA